MKVNFPPAFLHRILPVNLLIFCVFILITSCRNNNSGNTSGASATEGDATAAYDPSVRPAKLSIRPPLASVDVAPALHTVQPDQAAVVRMESGTELQIPAHSFVDENNQPVSTPVEIRFREFHESGQIIASGIPMHIRTGDGGQEYFKTAGMFEIEGVSAGKPVKIAEGKAIQVNLASQVDGAYDFWKFDPVAGNWDRQPQGDQGREASEAVVNTAPQAVSATISKPVRPIAYDEKKSRLNFNIDVNRFPQLRKYKNIIWLYAGKDAAKAPENNPWIGHVAWQEFKLDSLGPQLYQLTLSADEKEYSIPIAPSFVGDDLKKAMQAYSYEMNSYAAAKEFLKNKGAYDQESAMFRRSMEIRGFGLYNYDILWKKPDAIPLLADFDFGDMPEQVKHAVTVYLITEHGKTIAALPYYDWGKFRFSPSADNKLIALLPGNQVAVFTQADFNAQMENLKKARNGNYVFKMKVQDFRVGSLNELNQVIAKAG